MSDAEYQASKCRHGEISHCDGCVDDDFAAKDAEIKRLQQDLERTRARFGASRDREDMVKQIIALNRLREKAQEVWDSIPSTHDETSEECKRHAAALNALGSILRAEVEAGEPKP